VCELRFCVRESCAVFHSVLAAPVLGGGGGGDIDNTTEPLGSGGGAIATATEEELEGRLKAAVVSWVWDHNVPKPKPVFRIHLS
jgi:hypothetical protein